MMMAWKSLKVELTEKRDTIYTKKNWWTTWSLPHDLHGYVLQVLISFLTSSLTFQDYCWFSFFLFLFIEWFSLISFSFLIQAFSTFELLLTVLNACISVSYILHGNLAFFYGPRLRGGYYLGVILTLKGLKILSFFEDSNCCYQNNFVG